MSNVTKIYGTECLVEKMVKKEKPTTFEIGLINSAGHFALVTNRPTNNLILAVVIDRQEAQEIVRSLKSAIRKSFRDEITEEIKERENGRNE